MRKNRHAYREIGKEVLASLFQLSGRAGATELAEHHGGQVEERTLEERITRRDHVRLETAGRFLHRLSLADLVGGTFPTLRFGRRLLS